MAGIVIALLFFGVVAFLITQGFVIIRSGTVAVVERLGKYSKTLEAGWHILIPVVDVIVQRFDMREMLHDFQPTPVITKDNATVRINAVTYYFVTDTYAARYKVQNFEHAMEQLIITTLRNLIGELELDECLNGRNTINHKLQGILDETTHVWGLKVSRVELKEITPLGDVAEAMDKQMVAERSRRAAILEAEGLKRAAILQAEGAKESAILRAEGEREVVLIRAKAEAEAQVVAAKAQQEAIRELVAAFGQNAEEKFLQLRYLETLPRMADGRGSTVFMPTQMGQIPGLAALAGEAFRATQAVPVPPQQAHPQPQQARRPAPPAEPGTGVRIS